MKRTTVLLSLGLLASLGVASGLYFENSRLEKELAETVPLRTSAKPERHSAASNPGGGQGTKASPQARGTKPAGDSARRSGPASSGAADPIVTPGKSGALLILDNGDGNFTVSDPSGTWKKVMSGEELKELRQAMESTMQAAVTKMPGGPSWSPGRAAGPPDTADHGDYSTAWASQSPDAGKEWLQVKYPKSVEIGEINIHETYNPGAISKVSAIMPDGSEKVIWQGTMDPEQGVVERAVKVPPGIRSDQIRVELDTSRVPGWNEIDAVELVGTDGSRQWGSESTASSYYGQGRMGGVVFSDQLDLGLQLR